MAKFWLENGEVRSDEPLNFSAEQIEQIRLGLEKYADVSRAADWAIAMGHQEVAMVY